MEHFGGRKEDHGSGDTNSRWMPNFGDDHVGLETQKEKVPRRMKNVKKKKRVT